MSNVKYSNGKFFLSNDEQSLLLLDVRTAFINRSRIHSHELTEKGSVLYPLEIMVNAVSKKIFKGTPDSLAEVLIYLRIIARLLRKPQAHLILHIGQWSPLIEALAETLPKFNPANKLYCLSETRPLGKISSVNFIFAEGGEYLLPENKFDTIIFPKPKPPTEILLAVKDYGKIYFVAPNVDDFFKEQAKIFPLTKQASLFELEISPSSRQEIYKRTPQGQLKEKISMINQLVANLPIDKESRLDEYIAEVIRAEKILADIFPALHSDTIKFNFNVFKEILIDLRLGNTEVARVIQQHEILTRDLNRL